MFFSDLYVSDFAFGICPLVFQVTILHIKIKQNGISYFNIKVREGRCNKKVNIAKNSSLEVFKKEAINKTLNMFSFWQSAGSQRSISRERRAGWMFNPVKFAGYSCFTFEIIIHTVNSPVVSVNKKSVQTLSDTFEIMCWHTYSLFPSFHFVPAASKTGDVCLVFGMCYFREIVNVVVINVWCGFGILSSLFLKWRTFDVYGIRSRVAKTGCELLLMGYQAVVVVAGGSGSRTIFTLWLLLV